MTVDEIREDLFRPAALKMQGLSVGSEHVKIAEALNPEQRIVPGYDRKAEVVKLVFDGLGGDGLHNIAARVQLHRVARVL